MPQSKMTLTRTTSRVVVSIEAIPSRIDDLRFLARDEVSRLHTDQIVMSAGLSFTIIARNETSTTLEVVYYTARRTASMTKATVETVASAPFVPGPPTVEIDLGLDG